MFLKEEWKGKNIYMFKKKKFNYLIFNLIFITLIYKYNFIIHYISYIIY